MLRFYCWFFVEIMAHINLQRELHSTSELLDPTGRFYQRSAFSGLAVAVSYLIGNFPRTWTERYQMLTWFGFVLQVGCLLSLAIQVCCLRWLA